MHDLPWAELRVFLAAHRGGSLGAAARTLGIDATTVGRRLSALEDAAGTQLFQRTPDGLIPTAAADAIVEGTAVIERQVELIRRAVAGDDSKLEGLVRVAVTENFASHFLAPHLATFQRAHAAIAIELVVNDRLTDLARGDADVAVRFVSQGQDIPLASNAAVEIVASKVGRVAIGVFASKSYLKRAGTPRKLSDVRGHALVGPRTATSYLPGSAWFHAAEAHCRVVLRADGLASIASAAAAGLGLCALPMFMAPRYRELVHIDAPTVVDARDVWLLVPKDLRRVARVEAVRTFIVEVLHDHADALVGAQPRKR